MGGFAGRCLLVTGDLIRQSGDEIADSIELRVPADADAHQIDVPADKLAQRRRVLVSLLIAEVGEGYFAGQVFHTRDDILQAGGREQMHDRRRVGEIRIQCESVLLSSYDRDIPRWHALPAHSDSSWSRDPPIATRLKRNSGLTEPCDGASSQSSQRRYRRAARHPAPGRPRLQPMRYR
jgi:hypothetical protein